MRPVDLHNIAELQKIPANIRNICILAHVDHGKTTLADTLVAKNGIISQRMAGKLRYLDSREDEQLRGITMKSSAITLQYSTNEKNYLINLIDSPGHIDFSSEVSTAVRLCDGAIVVVDVVEGVCPQTHAVLRQAWLENIKPVLLLNKVDRLITELKMQPFEAHLHLQQILEQVNAITGELFTCEVLGKSGNNGDSKATDVEESSNPEEKVYDWSAGLEEADDDNLYFSPDQGNVIFGSAIDGWGFGIGQFAQLFAKKLGVSESALRKTLWGDFYLETKTKRIKKGAQAKAKKPLFVQFILENLWSVYEAVMERRDKERMDKIIKSLNLTIPPRDLRHNDPRVQLQAITSQWLPLSTAVLEMVVAKLPSPLEMIEERVEKLLCPQSRRFDSLPAATQKLKQAFLTCSPGEDEPTIVFVSKMFAVDRKMLPENRQRPLTQAEIAERREKARERHAQKMADQHDEGSKEAAVSDKEDSASTNGVTLIEEQPEKTAEDDQVFVAFARVFSGTVRRGQRLLVLGPKHDPARVAQQLSSCDRDLADLSRDLADLPRDLGQHITEISVDELYLFMGRELEELESVPAGNVLGIGGVTDHILKSATLSDTVFCPAFTAMYFEAAPIVRVAVEPKHAGEMPALVRGMRLLYQADPCVDILVQESGEHVLVAAGEVHLQKCIDDLTHRYAKIELNAGSPIVPFRETIVPPPKVDNVNEEIVQQNRPTKPKTTYDDSDSSDDEDKSLLEEGLVNMVTRNGKCSLRIRAVPLPESVTKLLEENAELLKTLDQYSAAKQAAEKSNSVVSKLAAETSQSIELFKQQISNAFDEEGGLFSGAVDQIWSFGPRRNGPNVLLNKVDGYNRVSVWSDVAKEGDFCKPRDYDNSIVSGFQLATLAGPMCEEPMMGVCFVIEEWTMADNETGADRSMAIIVEDEEKMMDGRKISECIEDRKMGRKISESLDEHLSAANTSKSDVEVTCERDCAAESVQKICDSEDVKETSAVVKPAEKRDSYGPISGQIMSCVKLGCRRAFQSQAQRLMAAMYSCQIQCTAEVLGKMYAVLGKRHGRILEEEMKEGSSTFFIIALIPVIESFGFAEEIRKKTSGLASPQLKFSHWEIISMDPYWVPTTEEEYMHFGEKADSENIARNYMNKVRRRKGLKVKEQIVEFGNKQRTLKKNK